MSKCINRNLVLVAGLAVASFWVGCADAPVEELGPLLEETLVPTAGKADTAYFSNLATELEGEFSSTLRIDVSDLSADEQEAERSRLDMHRFYVRDLAGKQLKLAKSQLNAEKLHLNLTADALEVDRIELVDGAVEIAYRISVETLVTKKELRQEGIIPGDLVDAVFPVSVAADPRDLFDRHGESCAAGFHAGDLTNENFFYYFDPSQTTCDMAMAPDAQFRVNALLPSTDTFPEYDRLVADGRVTAAVIFGAAETGAVYGGDWGVMMWRTFEVNLRLAKFTQIEGSAVGSRFVRTRGGIEEVVDVISPYDLEEQDGNGSALFVDLLGSHEILFYNGHSFYGSLDVLAHAENYPTDTYQILFMNSCWSYEYYTRQVATARSSEVDPDGWALVDVVNNTTYAHFAHMEESSRVLLWNLLAGAETGGVDPEGRRFSWQNIIASLNTSAKGECPRGEPNVDCREYQPRNAHEMYGVSGVRQNSYQPSGQSPTAN